MKHLHRNQLRYRLLIFALLIFMFLMSAGSRCFAQQAGAAFPMGVNLEGLADYMRTPLFVDAMKTSRKWGSAEKPWDTAAPVDAEGNPVGDAGTVVITDLPHMGGVYHLSFDGQADVVPLLSHASVTSARFDPKIARTTAEVTVEADATQLMLTFRHTHGGVRNVHLLRPDYPSGTKHIFTTEFLAAIKPFSTLRLMDYLATNDTKVVHWADRVKPADAQYTLSKGGPLEYAVALANISGKDLWVNIPDQADDNYIRQEAALFRASLASGRHVYLEYGNEVWNWAFASSHRNQAAAEIEAQSPASPLRVVTDTQWDDANNKYYWGTKRISERLLHIGSLWRGVYGAAAYARAVRPVLAGQIANPFLLKLQLGFIAKFGPPAKFIYGVAGAPYYSLSDETAKRTDLTTEAVLDELSGSVDAQNAVYAAYAQIASKAGVKLLAYEGGTDIKQDDRSLGAKLAANRDPRMQEITARYLTNWYKSGGGLFMYFTLCGGYNKWGAWGLTEDISNLHTPKFEGVRQVLAARKP